MGTRDDAGVECAVEQLRELGFFLSGVLPEYALTDVLRMQQLIGRYTDLPLPDLATEGGRTLLAAVTADRSI